MAMPIAWLATRLKCAFSHLNAPFWAMRPPHRGEECLFPKGRQQQNTYPAYKACSFFNLGGVTSTTPRPPKKKKRNTRAIVLSPRVFSFRGLRCELALRLIDDRTYQFKSAVCAFSRFYQLLAPSRNVG